MPAFQPNFQPGPSSIRIQRMLGATRPIRPPSLPKPAAMPSMPHINMLHPLMRPMRAFGGATHESAIVDSPASPFTGGIMSEGGGRTDDIQAHVPNGSYVVPAWAVAHLGQGNSINGMAVLKDMFGQPWGGARTPWGAPSPQLKAGRGIGIPKPPPMMTSPPWLVPGMSPQNPALAQRQTAAGGSARAHGGSPIPVNLSGGEFIVTPEKVAEVGAGNLDKGHRVIDHWMGGLKKNAVQTLQKLPGPVKS